MCSSDLTIASSAVAQNAPAVQNESRIIRISAQADAAPQHISLALNKAAVIELDRDARDVFVANPQIADAVVRTPRRIFIMSLKIGQTNAIFLDAQGKQIASLEINVGSDVADLNNQINRQIPEAKVRAASLNDTVVLGGTVTSVQQASQAQELASKFAGSQDKVVNMLQIDERQQVLIKVRVSEMSRNIAKQLGVNVNSVVNAQGLPVVLGTGNQFSLIGRALSDVSGAQVGQVCRTTQYLPRQIIDATQPPVVNFPGQTLNPIGVIPGPNVNIPGTTFGFSPTVLCNGQPNNVQGVVQALERVGLVHTLAEPNLTAVSGEAAKFLAGGEFPVPTSRDRDGNVTVSFKPFGVGLSLDRKSTRLNSSHT